MSSSTTKVNSSAALVPNSNPYTGGLAPNGKPYSETNPPHHRSDDGTAFWNVNILRHLHTDECPGYLEYAFKDHRDRAALLTLDAEYQPPTWAEVVDLISKNKLDAFRRVPSELPKYRAWSEGIKEKESIMEYIMRERLRWDVLTPSSHAKPFENPDDYKILYNDWRYGVDTRIVHLIVWTKFELKTEPKTAEKPNQDLTPEARGEIESFVERTFRRRCGKDNVIWFRNWAALKSVHAVEHIHVMLLDPDPKFLKEITNGDVPMSEKVGKQGGIQQADSGIDLGQV